MALVGSVSSHVGAQTTLPRLPGLTQPAVETEAGLLPYPFTKNPTASSERSVSQHLVKLFGLAVHAKTAASSSKFSLASSERLPVYDPQPPLSTCEAPASAVCPLPEPAQGSVTMSPVIPASATEGDPNDSLVSPAESESLLDIEIPLTLGFDDEQPGETTANKVETAVATTPANSLPGPSVSESLPVAHEAREPAIVHGPHTLGLTASPVRTTVAATHNKFSDADRSGGSNVQFSLRDDDSTASSNRPASLHLSSASNAALKTNPPPNPGLQVRIEGEPAPLLNASSIASTRQTKSAPLPTFAGSPLSPSSQLLPSGLASRKSVKASFASRTTPIVEQTPVPESETPSSESMRIGAALSVGVQNTATVSTEFAIVELSVEHPNICQLLKTSDKSASLIGMRPGSTRIAMICQRTNGERIVEVREVSVSGDAEAKVSLPQLAQEISQTVAKLYPNSDVQIAADNETLIVRGFTNYESDAKKILALVRKTSLTPVIDQLLTNGN